VKRTHTARAANCSKVSAPAGEAFQVSEPRPKEVVVRDNAPPSFERCVDSKDREIDTQARGRRCRA